MASSLLSVQLDVKQCLFADPKVLRVNVHVNIDSSTHSVYMCLFAAVRSDYCTDPDVTSGHGRGCPLVVLYWADLQSVHGLRCYVQ